MKLQQLISLMEEEAFKDEEYIATEGQLGEKFFIVVLGNVRVRELAQHQEKPSHPPLPVVKLVPLD